MSPEVHRHLSSENGQVIVERPVAHFVKAHRNPIKTVHPEHIRAYLGLQLMQRQSLYFHNGEKTDITGLEPYFIGLTLNPVEVAEEIGSHGNNILESLRIQDPYVMPRMRRLMATGRISTDIEEKQKDLEILTHADISIGNTVRKLNTQITNEGERFRAETHKLIGDPTDRFMYSPSSHSETLVLPQQKEIIRELGIQKLSLDEALRKLPVQLQAGYRFFSDLLKPVFAAPVERAFLLQIRQDLNRVF